MVKNSQTRLYRMIEIETWIPFCDRDLKDNWWSRHLCILLIEIHKHTLDRDLHASFWPRLLHTFIRELYVHSRSGLLWTLAHFLIYYFISCRCKWVWNSSHTHTIICTYNSGCFISILVDLMRMKCALFVRWSTMTQILSYPCYS